MKFQGAVIKEQDTVFAIVVVKMHIVNNSNEANNTINSFSPLFPGMPVVLMAQNFTGRPKYYGRNDIVRFLVNIPIHAIPWQEYTVS